jgi:hypothetical protein
MAAALQYILDFTDYYSGDCDPSSELGLPQLTIESLSTYHHLTLWSQLWNHLTWFYDSPGRSSLLGSPLWISWSIRCAFALFFVCMSQQLFVSRIYLPTAI